MSRTVTIESAGSERHVDETDFPLSLGGAGSDIALCHADGMGARAWIGFADGEIFLQAGDGSTSCNGIPVATSQWLRVPSPRSLRRSATVL